jgi:hypothetical protein
VRQVRTAQGERATALTADGRLTVTQGSSFLAPVEDGFAMLLEGVQARLQGMKHRDGAISPPSDLNQLVNDTFLSSNAFLRHRDVSLGLGEIVLFMGVVHGTRSLALAAGSSSRLGVGRGIRWVRPMLGH